MDLTLSNGLRVICIEKKNVPIISCIVYYKCGSDDDAISKSGVAHYLEHMAFFNNKCEFSDFLEGIGAEFNAFTSNQLICFEEVVPTEHIETVLKHESMRMGEFDIDIEKFKSEKGAILEERSMRTDNYPDGQYSELENAYIFNRIPIIGWRNEIESITPNDLVKFRNKWFAPNNAVIFLTGDIDVANIKSLVKKYFEKIPSKNIVRTKKNKDKPKNTKVIEFKSSKIGTLACANYTYFVPQTINKNFRKKMAAELAFAVLNQSKSMFKNTLEHSFNIANKIHFVYDHTSNIFDTLEIELQCSSIDNLYKSEDVLKYLLEKILCNGISETELNIVKRQNALADAYKKEDIATISFLMVNYFANGYSLEEIQKMDDVIQSINAKECNDILCEILKSSPIAISRMLPKEHDSD